MASFDIDTEKVKECAEAMDLEVTKCSDAIDNIMTILSKLNDPVEGSISGQDAVNYMNAINSSGDKEALTGFCIDLKSLVTALNDAANDLDDVVSKNKIV